MDRNEALHGIGGIPDVDTVLYVNPARIGDQETHDLLWSTLVEQLRAASGERQPRAELQYEVLMAREFHGSLPDLFAGVDLDLHAPIQGRDIASFNEEYRRFSLQEYEEVIALAHRLGARALILHLTPKDIPWDNGFAQETRARQLALALASFGHLVSYRDRHAPELLLVPEGLEYPKWWADTAEAEIVLPSLKKLDPCVTSCVDVAHLWHNRYLQPAPVTGNNFADQLGQHLQAVDAIAPVTKIHLAGAYIWQQEQGDALHATHAVPGLAPWERLEAGTHLFLDGPPPGFRGEWMAVGPVLETIALFGRRRGSLPAIAMEIHGQEMARKMQINALVRTILLRQMVDQL